MLELVSYTKTTAHPTERELILTCNRLERANRELHDIFASSAELFSGAALQRNQTLWNEMALRAAAVPAVTLEGVRARVRALGRDFVADILRSADATDEAERVMIEALIRDLTAND